MKWLSLMASKSIKLIIVSVFFVLAVGVRANPISLGPPKFFVSELRFDSLGEWIIKLESVSFDEPDIVDSVCVTTSSGSAKWKNPIFDYSVQQGLTIQNDDLYSDLAIRKEGDFVRVTTYYESWWSYDEVTYTMIFGDYPEATVRSPKEGESIVHVPVDFPYYYLDNYSNLYAIATIDESGESTVCTGTIRATIHNLTGQPFSESTIQFNDEHYSSIFDMKQQTDNVFTGNVFACRYSFDKLYKWVSPSSMYMYPISARTYYWTIDPVQFEMESDSVVLLDFYITGYVSLPTVKTEEADILKIYPNPIVGNSFNYETVLPVNSTNSAIDISGLNGQKIGHYPIFENKGNITLPSGIRRGVYTVSLVVNQKNYAATKITVP